MAKILVVDDVAMDRHRAGKLLTAFENPAGLAVVYAADGREALDVIQREQPDLVLTDLLMPEMNGLELVQEVRRKYPLTPIILMTAHGSEDIAIHALKDGAAAYVPKKSLSQDLRETVENVLEMTQARRGHQRVLDCLTQCEAHYFLENDPSLVPHLAAHLREDLVAMKFCNEADLIRIAVALREALVNAMLHGNLELTSDLLENGKGCAELIAERSKQHPYRGRQIQVTMTASRAEVTYVIRDEGPGFDPALVPDPTDPANLENPRGRGLFLIRTFMDAVSHNVTGNQITMIKRSHTDSHLMRDDRK